MTANRKWLLLPPACATLLVLGSLSMAPERGAAALPGPSPDQAMVSAAVPESQRTPTLPRMPETWQVGATLVGILLLSAAGFFVLQKMRHGPKPRSGTLVALRQSLRLSQRQALHAVEFDGRLLLIGEGERGLHLLHSGGLPEQTADEADVAARRVPAEPEDDGAVPKNLVIPRPERGPAAPQPPAPGRALGDFRALLAKAGR